MHKHNRMKEIEESGSAAFPHAHLMISERANDGIERSREQWFRRYNAKAPEKGGAKKSRTMMSREWVKDGTRTLTRRLHGARAPARSGRKRRPARRFGGRIAGSESITEALAERAD